MKCILLVASVAVLAGTVVAGQSKHKVKLTFDYDFTRQAPCSATMSAENVDKGGKQQNDCVQQFTAYDISAGWAKRAKLMSIPIPSGAHGKVTGISATTPLLLFESGRHLIAVVAQTLNGHESNPNQCTVWITIPDSTASSR